MPSEIVVCGVPFGTPAEKDALLRLKDLGVTSIQIYTYWRNFEPARNRFDFAALDREVSLIQNAGLKFVPFLLLGPRYATPDWWVNAPQHVGLRCLEHDKDCPIESIWNPAFRPEISRVLAAFAAHYLPWNVLESVQPGICGDYGEAIFPVLGNWPGTYHTHRGFWAGGADARASFKAHLARHYPSVDALNNAWRTRFAAFSDIEPFLPHRAPSRTALFDMLSWYRASMTNFAAFWMAECRRHFPNIPAYLCTGGSDDEITSGALFAAQAKAAAAHQGGIRLTNEGNKFDYNFPLTAPTHAACAFYGAYMGLEPVGPITEYGMRSRMFGSAAFGNRQVFHYYSNLFDKDNKPLPAAAALKSAAPLIQARPVEHGIAFFWPVDQATMDGKLSPDVFAALNHIRRRYPVSPISEEMILDGALDTYSCLVMVGALTARAAVLEKIAAWVKHSKDPVTLLSVGQCRDLELNSVPAFDDLFGLTPDSEDAWGHNHQLLNPPPEFTHVATLPGFHAEHGWIHFHPDTQALSTARPGIGSSGVEGVTWNHPVSALFRRRHGEPQKSQAIFYCGPVNFTRDPQSLFSDPGVLILLLDDVCALSGIAPLNTQPTEHARARLDGKTLILTETALNVS